MFKKDAVEFFGSQSKVAAAAGVDRSAVSQWRELVPESKASRLESASGGQLKYDPVIYDQHKQQRRKELSNESQST